MFSQSSKSFMLCFYFFHECISYYYYLHQHLKVSVSLKYLSMKMPELRVWPRVFSCVMTHQKDFMMNVKQTKSEHYVADQYLPNNQPGDRQRKWKRYLGETQAAWLDVGCSEEKPDRRVSHSFIWGMTWMWERWKQIQRSRKQQVKTDTESADDKMDILPAGRYLCLDDLSTSSSSTLVCCSAVSTSSKTILKSCDVTSCSWCPAPPTSGISDPVFEFIPSPGLPKQLVSILANREACVRAAVRSCCSMASRWSEFPTEFPAAGEVWSLSLRLSLRRLSSWKAILLPAVSTATPQEPPYWATNLTKKDQCKRVNLWLPIHS